MRAPSTGSTTPINGRPGASVRSGPSSYDVGQAPEAEGRPYLVMELLRGATLDEMMAGGPMPITPVVNLGVQVADALDVAHTAGTIHRDLKPANIFVTSRGDAKLLDFGLAAIVADSATGDSDAARPRPPRFRRGSARSRADRLPAASMPPRGWRAAIASSALRVGTDVYRKAPAYVPHDPTSSGLTVLAGGTFRDAATIVGLLLRSRSAATRCTHAISARRLQSRHASRCCWLTSRTRRAKRCSTAR